MPESIADWKRGRYRDRTDDLYRAKVVQEHYLVGSSRFLLRVP